MPDANEQTIVAIVAIIVVLVFLGMLFLITLFYYNNKKTQLARQNQLMKDNFEKQLLQSKLEIQEEIFTNISQEIHDNVGQLLSLAKVQLNILEHGQVLDKSLIGEVKSSVSFAMTDLRDIAMSLSKDRIQSFNLSEAVNREIQRINRLGILNASTIIKGEEKEITGQEKLIIFRMIQESLQNIIKHSGASEATIVFEYATDHKCILISDNGRGFDVPVEPNKANGLGLKNIFARAATIGATVSITSAGNGEGTTIKIIVPHA